MICYKMVLRSVRYDTGSQIKSVYDGYNKHAPTRNTEPKALDGRAAQQYNLLLLIPATPTRNMRSSRSWADRAGAHTETAQNKLMKRICSTQAVSVAHFGQGLNRLRWLFLGEAPIVIVRLISGRSFIILSNPHSRTWWCRWLRHHWLPPLSRCSTTIYHTTGQNIV